MAMSKQPSEPSDWSVLYATTASDLPVLCRFCTGAYNTRLDREVEFCVLHLSGIFFFFFVRKKNVCRDSNSRPNVSEGYEVTSELPGRPAGNRGMLALSSNLGFLFVLFSHPVSIVDNGVVSIRPTLMGTKNSNENGPNPVVFFGTKNTPRPSEHPGKNVKTFTVGWIKSCKYKTSSWHLNGFPDGRNIGSTVLCRGEAHRYTVIIIIIIINGTRARSLEPVVTECTFTLIAMDGHQKNIKNKPETMYYTITHGSSNIHYIGYKYKATTRYLNGFRNGSNLGSTV